MPVRGLLWIPIGLWSVAGLKEQGFPSGPSMVGVRSFLVAMIQNDAHTHTYIYIHIILYFILYICICMYTYAYIYDPWVGSPIRWSYLRVNVSIPGRFTLGAIAPAKHGIQNRRLRLPVVPRVETTWNNHIEWIKPDNLKTHERLWSSSLTFLIRFASLRRFCNSNWRAEWKILHAPYRMISILCGNQTCQTGTSPICISI